MAQNKPKKQHPEVAKTMAELRAWCDAEHGRQIELARYLGITKAAVNAWVTKDNDPVASRFFQIRDFLDAQHGNKK